MRPDNAKSISKALFLYSETIRPHRRFTFTLQFELVQLSGFQVYGRSAVARWDMGEGPAH